ncbi:PIN-like domain-containing protein [Methylocystis sp. SC2]|uniref:PIN-like domain-containing protein n=1 Tax=Methylocystis sp. (strain SC2) TaxID=187303 RepID=UPI00027AF0A9|nr:PIN-like domain-containing protein [Methylocystis sp. SC2]CCJ05880.1 Uncharacterized protein BN69_0429 [Methylocystis sp. SC2]
MIDLLDRRTDLDVLGALADAIHPLAEGDTFAIEHTAIALDANVFLRLSGHPKSADIIDYLGSRHSAPLILPGQAVQEFWNNQLQAVDTVSSSLKKKFDGLKTDFARVDSNFGPYASEIGDLLEQFSSEHGHVYDEATVRKTEALFEVLQKRALVPYVSRQCFREIADQRKRTKTPPGFKDEGDGDFFIWVDMLAGLLQAQQNGKEFARVVLVSQDKKTDWSRAGKAHPVLVAEVKSLVRVPFEIWTTDQLAQEIGGAVM